MENQKMFLQTFCRNALKSIISIDFDISAAWPRRNVFCLSEKPKDFSIFTNLLLLSKSDLLFLSILTYIS